MVYTKWTSLLIQKNDGVLMLILFKYSEQTKVSSVAQQWTGLSTISLMPHNVGMCVLNSCEHGYDCILYSECTKYSLNSEEL